MKPKGGLQMQFKKRNSKILYILLLAGAPLMFSSCVDNLIFQPPAPSYEPSGQLIKIPTASNQHIAAFYLPPQSESDFVILFSHGNAEDIGQNIEFARDCRQQGFGILLYDYRGYGLSDGRPSEQNTYQDIEAAYQHLVADAKIAPSRIIAHGRSVGSGPSTWLAARHPLGGLVLESPFVSVYRVVTRWPMIPFDKFNNLARIKNVHCPVLVIHGKQDSTVPFWHGQKLYDAANDPKQNCWVNDAGHNDLLYIAGETYWIALREFRTNILEHDEKTK
jgi:fermentation-respiration switch protein FrsA (DUF1100 family)